MALPYEAKALERAERIGDAGMVVDALLAEAYTLFSMGMADSAYNVNQRAVRRAKNVSRNRQSIIARQQAYYEILTDDLQQAEQHALEAYEKAEDASTKGNARSLLCQVYIRQGRPQEAERLLSEDSLQGSNALRHNQLALRSEMLEHEHRFAEALDAARELWYFDDSIAREKQRLDIVKLQGDYDQALLSGQQARQQLLFLSVTVGLLIVILALTIVYFLRIQHLYKHYHDHLESVREDMDRQLQRRDATIEDIKTRLDERLEELQQMQRRLPGQLRNDISFERIAQTKVGVDVLYAIVHGENISQMGRQEQMAVTRVMELVDPDLYTILSNPQLALTPKEAFFCIMERNGKSDQEKSQAFCCSEQAVRSTKSRLGKKLNIEDLHK